MSPVALDWIDLSIAALLVLANALLSLRLKLGLERPLLVAAARTAVQLFLIGFVIRELFALASPLWTGLMALVMVLLAGYEVQARQSRRFTGQWTLLLGTLSVGTGAGLVAILALAVVVQPEPWYQPRYAIPLLGMILGNAMTGVGLALESLLTTAARERVAIESRLALGADRFEALAPAARQALRNGLMPIINAMAAAGLIALPGMMTGQILAGVDPVEAVRYQILVMFLISGGTGFGVFLAVGLGRRHLSDSRHRLRLDRLRPANGR
jgi:putative ABC transport system permease protein